jgi:hypothetical protein
MKRPVLTLASLVLVGVTPGCGSPGGNDAGSGGACADTTSAEYKCDGATSVKTGDLWTNVINPRCVSTCHRPGGTAISYGDYSTAAQFQSQNVGVKSLYAGSKGTLKKVDPNNLQNSNFWLKTIGGSPASRKGPECESPGAAMPDGAAAIPDAEKTQIKNWICTGAQQ